MIEWQVISTTRGRGKGKCASKIYLRHIRRSNKTNEIAKKIIAWSKDQIYGNQNNWNWITNWMKLFVLLGETMIIIYLRRYVHVWNVFFVRWISKVRPTVENIEISLCLSGSIVPCRILSRITYVRRYYQQWLLTLFFLLFFSELFAMEAIQCEFSPSFMVAVCHVKWDAEKRKFALRKTSG